MPQCFQYSFGKKTTIIIDCFEVFIDRPSGLLARAQTFSSYEHHNTIKILIGFSSQGTISFTSDAWGGRTSDKFLMENCGFPEKLLPGDMVMADGGFTVHESIMFKQDELVIPAFTRGKYQRLEESPMSGYMLRGSLDCWRQYTILEGTLPIDYMIAQRDTAVPLIGRIIRVCASLVNLCPAIVPSD